MDTYKIGELPPDADRFKILRAEAVEHYGGLEVSMTHLLAALLKSHPKAAGVISSNILNTSARNNIVTELLGLRYGKKYHDFWKGKGGHGLLRTINALDTVRSQIVHWHTAVFLEWPPTMTLIKPNVFPRGHIKPIRISDLEAFCDKTDFVNRTLTIFTTSIDRPDLAIHEAWHGIFAQPFQYPAHEDHPLNRLRQERDTPPHTSPS